MTDGCGCLSQAQPDDANWAGTCCRLASLTEGSRPVMVTCAPRVGITLACWASQARLRRRHIEKPPQAIPASAMAQVEGSGTIACARKIPSFVPW